MYPRVRSNLGATLGLFFWLGFVSWSPACAEGDDKPIWPTNGWTTSTPEEQGMDSAALATLVNKEASQSVDSLLIVRHGRIVLEASYAPYTGDVPHNIFSSTKSVTSTLLGMAYKEGKLDRLDHPMLDFFTDRHVANVDDRKKAITVQNLLDMTSGIDWDQGFEGGKETSRVGQERSTNWTEFTLDRPMAHQPGEVYNYSNGDPHLVSAILTKLTGKLAEDYARQKLFAPLGIVDWHWERDPQGLTRGDGMLYLLPRDMAKVGYLYLHHGEWEGQALLPKGWADVLDHRLVGMHASYDPKLSYSHFFWVFPDKRVFMTTGKNGQLILVFPDLDIVTVLTARKQARHRALIDAIYGAVKSESALPSNPSADKQLADAVTDAAVEKPTPVGATPEIASEISGKRYHFPENPLGLKSFTLQLNGPEPHFEVEVSLSSPSGASIRYIQPMGLDGLYRKGSPKMSDPGVGLVTAAKGAWTNARTFVIDTPVLGYGEQQQVILTFDGKKMNFHRKVSVGEGWEAALDGERDE